MVLEELRKELNNIDSDIMLFENPSFDRSIVGLSDDDRVVYNFDEMIIELAEDDGIDIMEAQEFIEYNTIRALPYAGDKAPIIVYPINY